MSHCKHSGHVMQDGNQKHITNHLAQFRDKCTKFSNCIETIRTQENPLVLLHGEELKLKTICRFIASTPGNSSNVQGQCSDQERYEIVSELDDHLMAAVQEREDFRLIDDCLTNQPLNSIIEKICRLAEKQDKICSSNDTDVHTKIQSFINQELRDINCICEELEEEETKYQLPLVVYIGLGICLFTIVIIGVGIWYKKYRYQRSRKEGLNHIYEEVISSYDQLNLQNNEERVISQEGPSVMSTTWSIISTGNSAQDVENSYTKLKDPDSQTIFMNKLNFLSTLRDCKAVPSTPGRPAGDCTVLMPCQFCRIEQMVDVSQENLCLYCHAVIDFGQYDDKDSVM